ncbi:MAG: fibronectin type III domain-containing protein, partial [Promethearchaeota archaeon]
MILSWVAVLIAFVNIAVEFVLFVFLFRNKGKEQKEQNAPKKGSLNKNIRSLIKLLVILILPMFFLGIFYFKAGATGSEMDLNFTEKQFVDFFFYLFIILTGSAAGWHFLIGFKIIKKKLEINKIKVVILLFGIILTYIIVPGLGYLYFTRGNFGFIEDHYYWDDGPWLTWQDENSTDSITISWLTQQSVPTKLKWGISSSNMVEEIFNTSHSYIHHAQLTGLNPNTEYFYQISQPFSAFQEDKIFKFKTQPIVYRDFKFCIVGDMQPTDERTIQGGKIVAQGLIAENPDFIVQLGDISSTGILLNDWHRVLQTIPSFAATIPFQSVVGNHDYGGDGSKNYRDIFEYNYNSSKGNYYSFNYLNTHF